MNRKALSIFMAIAMSLQFFVIPKTAIAVTASSSKTIASNLTNNSNYGYRGAEACFTVYRLNVFSASRDTRAYVLYASNSDGYVLPGNTVIVRVPKSGGNNTVTLTDNTVMYSSESDDAYDYIRFKMPSKEITISINSGSIELTDYDESGRLVPRTTCRNGKCGCDGASEHGYLGCSGTHSYVIAYPFTIASLIPDAVLDVVVTGLDGVKYRPVTQTFYTVEGCTIETTLTNLNADCTSGELAPKYPTGRVLGVVGQAGVKSKGVSFINSDGTLKPTTLTSEKINAHQSFSFFVNVSNSIKYDNSYSGVYLPGADINTYVTLSSGVKSPGVGAANARISYDKTRMGVLGSAKTISTMNGIEIETYDDVAIVDERFHTGAVVIDVFNGIKTTTHLGYMGTSSHNGYGVTTNFTEEELQRGVYYQENTPNYWDASATADRHTTFKRVTANNIGGTGKNQCVYVYGDAIGLDVYPDFTKPSDIALTTSESKTVNINNVPASDLSFSSSNTKVATVASDGTVTATGVGTATITATATLPIRSTSGVKVTDSKSHTFTVTVTAGDLTVKKVPTASTIAYGSKLSDSTLSGGIVINSAGNEVSGTWEWDKPNTIPNASSSTSYTTTFTAANYKPVSVNITPVVTAIASTGSVPNYTKEYGDNSFTATVTGAIGDVTWESSNTSVAIIDNNGNVTIEGVGTTTLTATWTGDNNHNGGSASGTLTVSKGTLTVKTKPVASAIAYSAKLDSSTLSGGNVINSAGDTVSGTWTWENPETVPDVSITKKYKATFSASNYNTVSTDITLTVTKGDLTVATKPTTSAIEYGSTLSASAFSGGSVKDASGAVVTGKWTWDNPSIVPATGSATKYAATFTPTLSDRYNSAKSNVIVVVNATNSTGFVPNYTKEYGDESFTASVTGSVGTITWESSDTSVATIDNNGKVTIVGVGDTCLTALWTGDTNYVSGTASGVLTVSKGNLSVSTKPTISSINYGQALSASIISGGKAVNASGSTVGGGWSWKSPSEYPNVGITQYTVRFILTDTVHYNY